MMNESKQQLKPADDAQTLAIAKGILATPRKQFIDTFRQIVGIWADARDSHLTDLERNLHFQRTLHSMKGMSRVINIEGLTEHLHNYETKMRSLESFDTTISEIQILIASYCTKAELLLGVSLSQRDDHIVLSGSEVQDRLAQLNRNEATATEIVEWFRATAEAQLQYPIDRFFTDCKAIVERSCHDLGAVEPDIEFTTSLKLVAQKDAEILRHVMVHLLTNAVDHGLESPEERNILGKPSKGKINISINDSPEYLTVSIQDDGRGINLNQLKERAIAMNLLGESDKVTPQKVAQLVLAHGLSLKSEVSALSGRGLGLSAIKDLLVAIGGNISVRILNVSESQIASIRFVMLIPKSNVSSQIEHSRARKTEVAS